MGLGLLWILYAGWWSGYAGDFYIAVFMCYVGHLLASHP